MTLLQNTAVEGNLTVSSGTPDLSTFTANRASAGGTINVSAGATLKMGGTNTFPSNYTAHVLSSTSTVGYSGSNQTMSNETYGNLTLSGSEAKTMPGTALTIAGYFTTGSTAAGFNFSAKFLLQNSVQSYLMAFQATFLLRYRSKNRGI